MTSPQQIVANSGKKFSAYGWEERTRTEKTLVVLSADVPVETGRILADGRKQEMLDFTKPVEYSIVETTTGAPVSDGGFLKTDTVCPDIHKAWIDVTDSKGKIPYLTLDVTYSDGTGSFFPEPQVSFYSPVSDIYPVGGGPETWSSLKPAFYSAFEAELAREGLSAEKKGDPGTTSYVLARDGPKPSKAQMEQIVSRTAAKVVFEYLNATTLSEGRELSYSSVNVGPIA